MHKSFWHLAQNAPTSRLVSLKIRVLFLRARVYICGHPMVRQHVWFLEINATIAKSFRGELNGPQSVCIDYVLINSHVVRCQSQCKLQCNCLASNIVNTDIYTPDFNANTMNILFLLPGFFLLISIETNTNIIPRHIQCSIMLISRGEIRQHIKICRQNWRGSVHRCSHAIAFCDPRLTSARSDARVMRILCMNFQMGLDAWLNIGKPSVAFSIFCPEAPHRLHFEMEINFGFVRKLDNIWIRRCCIKLPTAHRILYQNHSVHVMSWVRMVSTLRSNSTLWMTYFTLSVSLSPAPLCFDSFSFE